MTISAKWRAYKDNLIERETFLSDSGDEGDRVHFVHSLGYLDQQEGNYERAESQFRSSLAMFRLLGNRRGMAACMTGLAGLKARQGEADWGAFMRSAADALLKVTGGAWWPAHRLEVDANQELIHLALGEHYLPLDELIAAVDYLILVVPFTPETENLLNRERIARMKPTASVINVGRGGLIDEEALFQALREGRLAMAGLDVFRREPLPQSSPLIGLQNVVLSPHMGGGASDRYWQVDVTGVLENIRRFFAGEPTTGQLAL